MSHKCCLFTAYVFPILLPKRVAFPKALVRTISDVVFTARMTIPIALRHVQKEVRLYYVALIRSYGAVCTRNDFHDNAHARTHARTHPHPHRHAAWTHASTHTPTHGHPYHTPVKTRTAWKVSPKISSISVRRQSTSFSQYNTMSYSFFIFVRRSSGFLHKHTKQA